MTAVVSTTRLFGTFTVTVSPVNDQPTLTAIADPAAIPEDSGLQTVNLAGISAGGGESQTLTVTATSDNTGLIPNPTVNYTSAERDRLARPTRRLRANPASHRSR